jgi:hypothetical protein
MSEFKNCPYCGEEIRLQAKKCKHCGEWLEEDKTKNIEKIVGLVEKVASVKQVNENHTKEASYLEQEEPLKNTSTPSVQHNTFWYDILTGNKTSNWVVIIAFVLLVIIHLSVPNYERHEQKIHWDIEELYKEDTSSESGDEFLDVLQSNDWRDAFLRKFHQGNSIRYDKTWFWSTAKIENVNYPMGEQVSLGIFGMVFTRIGKADIDLENQDWVGSTSAPALLWKGEENKKANTLVTTSNKGRYGYYLDRVDGVYTPVLVRYDETQDSVVDYFDFDIQTEENKQTKVEDETGNLVELSIDRIENYYVKGNSLYFIGFSSMLKSGIYYAVVFNTITNKAKIIAYGDNISFNKKKGELNYEQLRLVKDVGYEAGNEYETIYLKTKLK